MFMSKRSKANVKFTRKMQGALLFVFCVVFALILGLCARLVWLHANEGENYGKKLLAQHSLGTNTNLPYRRGDILDRNGAVLARSTKVFNVIFDPSIINMDENYAEPTINALVQIYGLDANELRSILVEKSTSAYIRLLRQQSLESKLAFEEYVANSDDRKKIQGVWFEKEYVRNYPFNSLASHVIGYTVGGDIGTWGIEQYYNEELIGTNGREYGYYDAELNLTKVSKPATDGNTIISTLDVNVQRIVEEKVKNFRQTWKCENTGVIVMNPNNGAIYAMASNEGFDLNDPRNLSAYYTPEEIAAMSEEESLNALNRMWRNFCISDTYEPGSTFKPFTVAAALEENLVKTTDTFICDGFRKVAGYRINCNRRSGHGVVTLTEALMKSCNPALMSIGELLGRDEFHRYQEHFGFSQLTGIDLPGESKSILIPIENLNVTELATSSFGQGFNITMVQLASAFCSLINGGNYYQPHVVEQIRNSAGTVVYENPGVVLSASVSAQTSEFMRQAMFMTVDSGTASPAKVEGYLVGGKTGTAQKGVRDKENQKYVVSFVGCVPTDDPQVVIYVVIDEIHDEEKKASSSLATALTSEILEEILPYLGVYPEGEINYHIDLPVNDPSTDLGDMQEGDIITPEEANP